MIEHFRPAGHKAQELSEIVMPDELFKPIQRVIDTTLESDDKTIGYLYRDIEYAPGVIDGFVLSKGLLRNVDEDMRESVVGWQEYETDDTDNPLGWFIPSAQVILELCYRTQHEDTVVSREAQQSWHETFKPKPWWPLTSTLLDYSNGSARVYHNWTTNTGTAPVPEEVDLDLSSNNAPIVNNFLHATLGKRYSTIKETFGEYRTPITLWTPRNIVTGTRTLVLGVSDNGFYMSANDNIGNFGPARGVAIAKKLLEDKRYEVRDD
ncbi:TPA: hypothetical protein HA251_02360 [Candidatus Woesearchaeota archaeon]|nr:hypothetical protein [Candidatus Woesearchaeota archaeon]